MIFSSLVRLVDKFFDELATLPVKDLGRAPKFLGMWVNYGDVEEYNLGQEVMISDLLRMNGLEMAQSVRMPIGDAWNELDRASSKCYALWARMEKSLTGFQSLMGSLL